MKQNALFIKILSKHVKTIPLELSKLFNPPLRIKNPLKCQIYFKEYKQSINKNLQTESNNIHSDQKRFHMNSINECNSFFKNKEGLSSKEASKTQESRHT